LLAQDLIRVIDAFDTPRFKYNHVRKIMTGVDSRKPLHGEAADKVTLATAAAGVCAESLRRMSLRVQAEVLRERYQIIQQLLLRNEKFAPPPIQKGPASR
jgi:hypothetical protein